MVGADAQLPPSARLRQHPEDRTRFAPPTENNTAKYIQFCAREVGTLADNRLERYTEYAMLAVAMARMETSVRLTWPQVMKVMKKFNVFPF